MISVLYAPLFEAEYLDGRTQSIGLRRVLLDAHNIRDVLARSCTGKVALYRLFLAFIMDAWELKNLKARRRLFEEGRFDAEMVDAYIQSCEAEGASFDLDDDARPFMQAAYDPELDEKAGKPVAALMESLPSGNNHVHWDHTRMDTCEVPVAEAFEAMLISYAFCTSGTAGPSNVNNTPPLFAFVHGRNLFETLVLNAVSEKEMGNCPYGLGEVAWRMNHKVKPREEVHEMTLLRGLSLQPRRARLVIEEDGMVRRIFLQAGLDFRGDGLWRDPNLPYRQTKKGELTTIKPDVGRALWRDAGSLVAGGSNQAPITLDNLGRVWEPCPSYLDVELMGIATNQASLLSWAQERLRMLLCLLENEYAAEEFKAVLQHVEELYGSLTRTIRSKLSRTGRKTQEYQVADQAGEIFLQGSYETVFGAYLTALQQQTPVAERMRAVWDGLREALKDALYRVVDASGWDVATLQKHNEIHNSVWGSYSKRRKEFEGR